jgi:hypothetical protein
VSQSTIPMRHFCLSFIIARISVVTCRGVLFVVSISQIACLLWLFSASMSGVSRISAARFSLSYAFL